MSQVQRVRFFSLESTRTYRVRKLQASRELLANLAKPLIESRWMQF